MSGAAITLIVLGVLAALGFGGCGVCVVVTAMTMPDDAGTSATTTPPVVPDARQKAAPVTVDIATLVAQFHADAGAAEARYRGVYIEVTGFVTVAEVHGWVHLSDKPSSAPKLVQAFDGNAVRCKWAGGFLEMPDFKVGERATIVGYVDSGGDMGVFLEDCAKK
jgi:hypothetical protein